MSNYILDLRPLPKPTRPVDTVLPTQPSRVVQMMVTNQPVRNWWGEATQKLPVARFNFWQATATTAAIILLAATPLVTSAAGKHRINRPSAQPSKTLTTPTKTVTITAQAAPTQLVSKQSVVTAPVSSAPAAASVPAPTPAHTQATTQTSASTTVTTQNPLPISTKPVIPTTLLNPTVANF